MTGQSSCKTYFAGLGAENYQGGVQRVGELGQASREAWHVITKKDIFSALEMLAKNISVCKLLYFPLDAL